MELSPYADHLPTLPKTLGNLYTKTFEYVPASDDEEYHRVVNACRALTGEEFYQLHSRIEKGFENESAEFLISRLKEWYFEAYKSDRPSIVFNAKFKEYRERI